MSRILIVAALLAAGCSSPQKKTPMYPPDDSTAVETDGNAGPDKEAMNEPEGCSVEITPHMPSGAEAVYITDSENELVTPRQQFSEFCSNTIPVVVDWNAMFASSGYDAGEQVGAVSSGCQVFLEATRDICNSDAGNAFRDKYKKVVCTATDTDERVGLCFDDATETVVYRIKLNPGDATTTQIDAGQITQWFDSNMQ